MPHGIVLIGFMGAGKSSIGRALSRRLHLRLVDTDAAIEAETGQTISQLFAARGEVTFRGIETQFLERLAHQKAAIVATGGGVVTRPENWPLLRRLGVIVYLKASPDVLFERVRKHSHRPLLQTENPRDAFDRLLSSRVALYEQADMIVETAQRRPHEVAALLAERLRREGLVRSPAHHNEKQTQ